MINEEYWKKEVVEPIKKYITQGYDGKSFNSFKVERILENYCNDEVKIYLFDSFKNDYSDYCRGKGMDFLIVNIMRKYMNFEDNLIKVIPKFSIFDITDSWVENKKAVKISDYINIVTLYDKAISSLQWEEIERCVNDKLRVIKEFGDEIRCGYYALLHGYIKIRKSVAPNDTETFKHQLDLFVNNWDFIKLVYSVIIGRICDCRHQNFAAVANNIILQKNNYKYVHIFYSALKEQIDELNTTKKDRINLIYHLNRILEIQKNTPQDIDTLDELCKILFDELQQFLRDNKLPSYDEVYNELAEMKNKVNSLNTMMRDMAKQMVDAINSAIPIDDIRNNLLQLSPGTAYDVYTQVNSLLVGNKAWMQHAADIKEQILGSHETSIVINGNVYQRGAVHDDKSKHLDVRNNDSKIKLLDNE